MASYGTIMIGKLKSGASVDDWRKSLEDWKTRNVPGFQGEYTLVSDEGRISWMIDGYTTSENYPYARRFRLGRDRINYVRNDTDSDRIILMCDVKRPLNPLGAVFNFFYQGVSRAL